jgi:hypothetical protein
MPDAEIDTLIETDVHLLRAIQNNLRQAGIGLDRMCLTATLEGLPDSLQLADASQAVHRAMVALNGNLLVSADPWT